MRYGQKQILPCPYLTHYYVTMYIKYSYDDITSMKGYSYSL